MHKQEAGALADGGVYKAKHTALQIRVVVFAFLAALLDGLDLQIIAYAAPAIAKNLSLTESSLGIIFSGGFAGLAAGSILVAPLGDRWGRRPIIISCLVLFGACVLITPLAANAQQLFVLRVFTGLGLGGVMPNAIAISMEFAASRLRASMVSFTYFGFVIGGAAGGIVAATLIPLVGWKGMMFVVGLLPLMLALVLFFFLPESPEYRANKERATNRTNSIHNARGDGTSESAEHGRALRSSPMREIFSLENRRNSALMWLAMFANLSVAFGILQWLPTLLNQAGFALGSANSLVALLWISTAPGVILMLYVANMLGLPRAVGLFLCVGSVVTFGLGVVIATAASDAVWLLMVGIGMTVTAAQVGFYSLLTAVYPGSSRVTGIGWAQGVGRLGAVVGPSAIGFLLAGSTSTIALFAYVSIPVLISAVAVWQVRPLRLAA